MKHQLAELADHRCRILKRIEAQRADVADIARHLQKPMKYFDAGLNAAHFVYRHPTLFAGGLAAILTFWRNGIPGINYIIPPILRFAFNRFLFNSRSVNQPPSESNFDDLN
jgi:hypothetical protein